MTLKTGFDYNEDNFEQQGETLQELTVTITLCEYRNLLIDLTSADKNLDILHEKNRELEEENSKLKEAIALIKLPEWLNALRNLFEGQEEQENEEE